jgi:hypothetical protein
MSDTPTASPVVLGRWEKPGNLAAIAGLAANGQITIRPHELIRTTDGRVYHWTGTALEITSAPVHHGTVADVAALAGIYLLPSCTRGVHQGDTAYVTAAACEYRVTSGINATATWSACASIPTSASAIGADPSGTADAAVSTHNTATDSHADIRADLASAVSTHNTATDAHADIRTLVAGRALIGHQHARADLPWVTEPGAALLTADSASAQRTALGMTAWAVAPWTDGTTSDIPEGTQLYFTNARADARADARIAAQKGQAEGIMPLDSGGKAPLAYMPDALIGQVKFKGVWDAATNSPVLPSATASMGHYYVTSVAGSYGGIDYDVGDWCISDGTTWGKVDNTDAVVSFNGRIGAILPIASDYAAHYLGLHAQADDAAKLGGQLPSYYSQADHTHTFAGLTSKPTTLAGYGITDAAAASHTHSGYETAIGNPSADGYLLSSTAGGVRSWVAPYSHPATHAQSVIDSSSGWITTALDGKQPAGSYLTTTGTAADSEKLGGVAASGYSQTSHTHNYAGSSTPGGAATTALACTGNAATATTAASCTGNSATATTASSCSGNAATATALATPRTLTIGSKANTFDGTADKTWSLAEIGAASTTALTTEATTRANRDNALWAALYAEQTGGTECIIPLAATGDGSGVLTIRLWSDVANTAKISAGAFYAELAGTTNLGQSVDMMAGAYTTFYIKLPASTTATLTITYGWALTKWGQSGTECIIEATNAPKLNGFDVKYIPQNVTTIQLNSNLGTSIVTGSTRAWSSATSISFSGSLMTLSGTTYPWSSAIQIWFNGSSMTLSGTTYPWVAATVVYFSGNSMTLSGTTYPWSSATAILFYGNLMTLTANLSKSCLTTGNLLLYLSGTDIAVTYPTTRTWPTTMRQVILRPSVGSMPTADTDRLFIDIDATCTTASGDKVLDARGNCGAVTADSFAARSSLVAKGFAVSYNSNS